MKQQQRLRARQPLSHKPETWLLHHLLSPNSHHKPLNSPTVLPNSRDAAVPFKWRCVCCVCLSGDGASAVHHVMWGVPRTSSGLFLLSTEIILVGRPQCITRNAFHQMDVSLGCFNFTESSSEDDHARMKKNPRFFLLGKQSAPLRSSDASGCLGHSVPKALLFLYFGSLGSKAPSCGSR